MDLAPQFYSGPIAAPLVKLTDHDGHLMLVRPRSTTTFTHPDGKRVDAVRAEAVVLDGPESPLVLRGLVVTQSVLVRALRGRLEAGAEPMMLARLVRVPHRKDPDAMVWIFQDATEADVEVAQAYLDRHGSPFSAAA